MTQPAPVVLYLAPGSHQSPFHQAFVQGLEGEGYRHGATYYITKPCEPDAVLDIADYLIGNLGSKERKTLEARLF